MGGLYLAQTEFWNSFLLVCVQTQQGVETHPCRDTPCVSSTGGSWLKLGPSPGLKACNIRKHDMILDWSERVYIFLMLASCLGLVRTVPERIGIQTVSTCMLASKCGDRISHQMCLLPCANTAAALCAYGKARSGCNIRVLVVISGF